MKHLTNKKLARVLALTLLMVLALAATALAAGETSAADAAAQAAETVETAEAGQDSVGLKAIATGLAIGLAAAGGAIAMGMAASKSVEGIARQPEAEGKIRTTFMLALVFIETAIIYALLAAILIIFVL